MMGLRQPACNGVSAAAVVAAVVVSALLSEGTAHAQAGNDVATAPVGYVDLRSSGDLFGVTGGGTIAAAVRNDRSANKPTSLRESVGAVREPLLLLSNGRQPARAARSSVGRKVAGGVFGAVGGFYAGGYVGARIEGNRCNCDLAGFKGAIIGAPIGAVLGAILGATFF